MGEGCKNRNVGDRAPNVFSAGAPLRVGSPGALGPSLEGRARGRAAPVPQLRPVTVRRLRLACGQPNPGPVYRG